MTGTRVPSLSSLRAPILVPLCVVGVLAAFIALAGPPPGSPVQVSPATLLMTGALMFAGALVLLVRTRVGARLFGVPPRFDDLTGLPARDALCRDIGRMAASGDEVAVAIVDLDDFKLVNDRYGHDVGDALICNCASLFVETAGAQARCYRLAGDTFAFAMRGRVAGTILEGLCRTLLQRLATPLLVDEREIPVGAGIGLARIAPGEDMRAPELLRRADVAMFMAKRGGRTRCTWFSPTFDQRREAVRGIEQGLRRALEADEFAIHYQPLVDARGERIVAAEALLRWNPRDAERVSPSTFIPIAEETGLIGPIGLWVLRKALRDASRWPGITLSVNLSAVQLRNPEFPIRLGEILEETGFPPHRLELEVTETCLVLEPLVAERALDVIRGFGVHISLDDFGTGYASIGFLRRFRFEKLKLDRSLVSEAGEDEGSRALMLSSIAMARALDMGVTAEGVETAEQAEMVRLAGCDRIQGWLYHAAVPADRIDNLIARQDEASGEAHGASGMDIRDRPARRAATTADGQVA